MSDTSAIDIVSQVRSNIRSASDVVQQCLQRISAQNVQLNAFAEVWDDWAIQQAAAIDAKQKAGQPLGPLAGVPIAIKDNICVKDRVCGCASKMLQTYRPSFQATVVDRLLAADAVIVGRTNMDEFAMGSATEYSFYGPTKNPRNIECSPGGSSGGSAAAVASGMVPLALGSDTGGSIRQPAAFCGVVGLKPTYGMVSRFGLVAYASSLDQIGPFAGSAADARILLEVIAGNDPLDATSTAEKSFDYSPKSKLRIGVLRQQWNSHLAASVGKALQESTDQLSKTCELVDVELPFQEHAIATYYLLASSEAASNLSRYDGMHFGHRTQQSGGLEETIRASRGEGFGTEVKRRILLGTFALSEGYADQYYNQALKVRQKIADAYQTAFQSVDVLLGPTTAEPAFGIGCHADNPVAMYQTDEFTVGANLAGIPALSLPWGTDEKGLPIGLQLQAAAGRESDLLHLAEMMMA